MVETCWVSKYRGILILCSFHFLFERGPLVDATPRISFLGRQPETLSNRAVAGQSMECVGVEEASSTRGVSHELRIAYHNLENTGGGFPVAIWVNIFCNRFSFLSSAALPGNVFLGGARGGRCAELASAFFISCTASVGAAVGSLGSNRITVYDSEW